MQNMQKNEKELHSLKKNKGNGLLSAWKLSSIVFSELIISFQWFLNPPLCSGGIV